MIGSRIAKVLTRLLDERNMRVSELAKKVKLPQPTVHRIVTGACPNPHLSSLKPLADFFSITIDQLRGLDPIYSFEKVSKIPLLNWIDAIEWPNNKKKIKNSQIILTDANVSQHAYALQINDTSMEPIFPKNTFLIVDPKKQAKDRSYVIAKLDIFSEPIFRQLLIDIKKRYLKPLTPDLEKYKMTPLNNNDKILATLIQAKRDYDD